MNPWLLEQVVLLSSQRGSITLTVYQVLCSVGCLKMMVVLVLLLSRADTGDFTFGCDGSRLQRGRKEEMNER